MLKDKRLPSLKDKFREKVEVEVVVVDILDTEIKKPKPKVVKTYKK